MLQPKALFLSIIGCCFLHFAAAEPTSLPLAFAHNDYAHPNPLFDALAEGFNTVEADILLIDGELFVAHDMPEGEHNLKTLGELYLAPLKERINQNEGWVYPGHKKTFYLMIDIKTDAEETYAVLREELKNYRKLLSREENGEFIPGPLFIFLSGNRPIEPLRNETVRLAGIDGRPDELGKAYSPEFMPVISQHYGRVIELDEEGNLTPHGRKNLENLTSRARDEGKKVRLWATPEDENLWEALLESGVKLINTDELTRLRIFLENRKLKNQG